MGPWIKKKVGPQKVNLYQLGLPCIVSEWALHFLQPFGHTLGMLVLRLFCSVH